MTGAAGAVGEIARRLAPGFQPRLGLVLGSGLGDFADRHVKARASVSFADLPGFPATNVGGHAGRLTLGAIGGLPSAILQGRAHYYENGDIAIMKRPIMALKELGCDSVILTNAAGSLRPEMGPGSVMMLNDHVNLVQVSPLFGETGSARFFDMADAYDPDLRRRLRASAARIGLEMHEGVYGWFAGPQFETPAEIRMAQRLGIDAVGMSTVPETILARYAGLRVAGLSAITNLGAGLGDTRLSHAHTLEQAEKAALDLARLILDFATELSR